MPPQPKVQINIQLPVELYDHLKSAADARGTFPATLAKQCIINELKYIARKEKAKPKNEEPWLVPDQDILGAE